MSEETQNQETQGEAPPPLENAPDELTVLKARAKLMGITHSNNISIETLREKIAAKLAEDDPDELPEDPPEEEQAQALNPLELALADAAKPVKPLTLREKLVKENMKLVRIRLANMNPNKKTLPGEIFTIANEYLGTVKKYVPYGSEFYENGYHVPYCIYKRLRGRKFQHIQTSRNRKTGEIVTKTSMAPEFSIELLPALTKAEIQQLATAQQAGNNLS